MKEDHSPAEELDLSELDALLSDYQTEDRKIPSSRTKSARPALPKIRTFHLPKLSLQISRKQLLYSGIGAATVIACILAFMLIGAALDPYDSRILPNTTIGGIPVGGMTQSEARKALKTATATFSRETMVVTLPDGTIELTPENTKVRLDVRGAVSEAYRLGRKGTDAENLAALEQANATGIQVDMLPYLKQKDAHIRTQLEQYAAQFNVSHTELQYHLAGQQPPLAEDQYDAAAPMQALELTLGTPEEKLDVDAVMAEILKAYSFNTFQVSIESIPHLSTPKDPDLDALYQEFYTAPVNTTLDMTTYQQIPGAYGYALDLDAAKTLLSQADYGDTISIPMTYVKPEILADEVYFREQLGYCETKHTNNENRNTNLRLACAAIDGLILQPGEVFSFNGTVGQRTKEGGYMPAAAYSGYNTVDAIGGGVCQVSTTLYNAALLADMEIVFRINHGFRSGYIGIGLDATVSWPNPDFQFRNSFHFPIMIKAEVSDGFVKFGIWGTDEKDYYVKMTSGYSEDETNYYAWSYRNKYDKETDELISKEKEAYSRYLR